MVNRRNFLALLSSGIASHTAISALAAPVPPAPVSKRPPSAAKSKRRPNVVFMICDDLGFGDLGCYGSKLPTPNLDALAADGMRFTHLNAGHPICSASRAAVLTGRYGTRCATTGAFGPKGAFGTSVDETFASNLFHAHGYKTKAIGKWHLGSQPEYLPTNRGFDSFYGVPYSIDMKPLPLMRDLTNLEEDTDRTLLTPRYTEEAVKYISESQGDPFFLYFAFSYPHEPARAFGALPRQDKTRQRRRLHRGDRLERRRGSCARLSVKASPTTLSSASPAITAPGIRAIPAHCADAKHPPLKAASVFPSLPSGQDISLPARVANAWCSNLDVLPTLVAQCGLSLPEKPLDGIDISPILFGDDKDLPRKTHPLLQPDGPGRQ